MYGNAKGEKIMNGFAYRLGACLNASGMTQRQQAEAAGITEAAVSKYLSGERVPRSVTVGALARALGVSVAALLDEPAADGDSVPEAVSVIARNARSLTDEQKQILFRAIANLKD